VVYWVLRGCINEEAFLVSVGIAPMILSA
jgi:hypothetical protein